ncbi:PDDEXK nuclease domain-containing protein [Nostoc sp. CHAB 5784]|uniref:PDDEXK nuclease domain-containing protein n=1 Tax=Nostoc mirabile TaxID=2907820 RepID=UPI001E4B164B|nr:PDDEXK nuclease domain-containing protein [Nostoc mirabile]MCC5668323.1 PDDEXK nuclease domain-containing protein [Nostoc mirabile CHAB5784]
MTDSLFPELSNYDAFLSILKQRIRTAQVRAALAVNQELVLLYWQIGREILQRQQDEGWGTKVIERIAKDLKREFPEIKGFSRTNLLYMRAFASAYPDEQFVQQAAGQIPWFHNCVLLDRVKAPEQRVWYIQQTIQNGWSRAILEMQIESRLYSRQGSAVTNFSQTLPKPQSDLAQQLIKDPYHFDFLTLSKEAQERDLERALVDRIRDFLLELGAGFSFVGSQYPIEVSGQEYRLDLLFYHLKLRCFVIIDLKMVEFQPEFSGKMNFYVSAVNAILRHPDDQPTIGIILCKSKNKTIAELALQGMTQPIGVSTHKIGKDVPEQLKGIMPMVEQLEMELDTAAAELEKQKQGRLET